jgi:hypothetical protein
MHLSIKYNASGAVTHFHDCNETMAIQREYKNQTLVSNNDEYYRSSGGLKTRLRTFITIHYTLAFHRIMIINIHLSSHQTSTHSTLKDNRQKK